MKTNQESTTVELMFISFWTIDQFLTENIVAEKIEIAMKINAPSSNFPV